MLRTDNKKLLAILSAAVIGIAAGNSWAQDDSGAAAGGADSATAATAVNPETLVKPLPSEMEPLTYKSLILDAVNTGEHVIAVGARGAVLVSNNGKDWAQVQTPVRAMLTSVFFIDSKNGWAVGHDATILHTTDGGRTWQLQNFHPELEKPFLQIICTDASTCVAVGAYGLLERTTDAGATWTAVNAPSILADQLHLNSITRLGNGDLLIAGEQSMLGLSSDGGATWTKLPPPYDGSLFGALPVGQTGAMIYGLRGNVFVTDDVKSNKWTKLDTGTVASFFGGTILPNGDRILVGLAGTVLDIKPGTNAVSQIQISQAVDGSNGKQKQQVVTSTLSSVIPFGSGILVTGSQGVQTVAQIQ
ncbi:MAG: WD40/YVTN/BNR-like repeat-containing protein [Stenotrophobium sp.]